MQVIILIIVFVAGVALGWTLGRKQRPKHRRNTHTPANSLIKRQSETKTKRLSAVEAFSKRHGKVTNDDIQQLLGVSDATAERYLDELERQGLLKQHGSTGRSVYYTPASGSTENSDI